MIEGLNILNTVEKVSASDLRIGILEIVLGLFCIGIGFYLIYLIFEEKLFVPTAFLMVALAVFDFILGAGDIYFGIKHITRRQTFINATVDENVSWKQINEQYDLVNKDGQIYTFTLKDAE